MLRGCDLLSITFSLPMNWCPYFNKVKAISLSRLPFVGILDINNGSNTNFIKKLIFRVKVLNFRFGCS